MFELNIDALKEQGLQFVDSAKKTALNLADKGKNQLDLVNQQARMSKAERQLGALVYSLHKAGEDNQPLVGKYIAAIADIEAEIEEIKSRMTEAERSEAEQAAAAEQEEPIVAEEPAQEAEAEAEEEIEELPDPNATKQCPVCGSMVDTDALFCNHCGAQL